MDPHPPLIGIVLNWSDSPGASPCYTLGHRYSQAVVDAGGLPVAIPHHGECLAAWLARLQGLVVSGGDYPFPANWYMPGHGTPYGEIHSTREQFDSALIHAALARGLPVLGICAGMQILGALHGCRLYGQLHGDIDHRQQGPMDSPTHGVTVEPGSVLAALGGGGQWRVNSLHNEAIAEAGPGVRVSARAEDGMIEAIELPDQPFAVGVQWHPEWLAQQSVADAALFRGLVAAARD